MIGDSHTGYRVRNDSRLSDTKRSSMTQAGAIDRVGVVGAGFMGSGIAESVARAGLHVSCA
jgi:predicted homoserine dehydrogenase-like protein